MFRGNKRNTRGGPPEMLGPKIGRWIVWGVFVAIEWFLYERIQTSSASGGNSTLYWGLFIGMWIVFGAIERLLKRR